ncbi:cell division protein ZipA [Billgrantia diversa]|uniref:cell division protein ZipA n=1 Tax=Halomonas sp. MCCC 1A13316 TaxID=2733487 RepID=UPI0018A69A0D|nr:cell division protein ZipA [Halomonas sp. MCCC 1A13316]QOR37603.1 cell division protein ZipA [Halomonas sp. MCCC 1A13316]
MELREWLIILGLALVTLIVIDGVRRLKRQRRVPRLDQVGDNNNPGNGQAVADAEGNDNPELPNGGARIVKPASYTQVQAKPKLERQEHPGPSRVLAGLKGGSIEPRPMPNPDSGATATTRPVASAMPQESPSAEPVTAQASGRDEGRDVEEAPAAASPPQDEPQARQEPTLSALEEEAPVAETEPLAADPADHDPHHDDDERYRLVDLEGMGDSFKSGSRRMGESVQRFGLSMQQRMAKRREQKREEKERREQARAEKTAREANQRREAAEAQAAREAERQRLEAEAIELADDDDPLFAPPRSRAAERDRSAYAEPAASDHGEPTTAAAEAINDDDVVRTHPTLARALRHNVNAERARDTLSQADEIIVISVLSRDEEGFSGEALLNLMLACGLRYSSDMGIFHRFETEDPDSELQFSMLNVVKPGTFPIEAMDEFRTPGITLLMPLPGALDTAAAFEAMVETAMVIVRNLGGELKDENRSVMTAQTVEFARQRVQEFERRNRLNRYQVN